MVRFWLKSLLLTGAVSALFAVVAANLEIDDAGTARGRGLAVAAAVLRSSFVEPLGLPLATALVAAAMLMVCGFFALGGIGRMRDEAAEPIGLDNHLAGKFALPEGPDIAGRCLAINEFRTANSPPSRSFGRKHALERQAAGPSDQDPARIALRVLSGNSLDWYFTEYGFEGRWRDAHAGLVESGEANLADILWRAGHSYERYIDDVFTPAAGEPAADDNARYWVEMQVFNREWRAAAPLTA